MSALLDDTLLSRIADGLDPVADPWANDGPGWIRHRLGEHTWSKQDEILDSVRDHKFTAVPSCHSSGKSHIASRVLAWWMDTHPLDQTFIVSTAPSANQVKGILWRYLKSLHKKAGLPGYITEAEVPEWKIEGGLRGWGRKPADLTSAEEAATIFQGTHAKYLLVVIDEACGVPEWLWTAISTLVTQPTNRVLAIGNPDDPASHFAKVCMPGTRWNKIRIRAADTPNFTGERVATEISENLIGPEWVRDAIEDYGEDSPYYISKVLAEFPATSEDNLIPIAAIEAACQRDFSGEAVADLGKFALDVGRQGKDESVLGFWRAGMFRVVEARRGIGNTMRLVGWLSNHHGERPASPFIVDADGIGGPVLDRARELRLPAGGFQAQRQAFNPKKFVNRRSEQWWTLRELFLAGLVDIDPADTKLCSQLSSIRYEEDSKGRISVESKKDMRKRGLPSPDRADTLMMVTAPADDWTEAFDEDEGSALAPAQPESLTGDLLTREW